MTLMGRWVTLCPTQWQPLNWEIPAHACKCQASIFTAANITKWQNAEYVKELENIWDTWKSFFVIEFMKGGRKYNPLSAVLCTQKNKIILSKTPPLQGGWGLCPTNKVLLLVFSHTSCIHTAGWGWFQNFVSVCLSTVTAQTFQNLSLHPNEFRNTSPAWTAGLLKCYMTLILANQSSN